MLIERDSERWLVATVPSLEGCYTQARNFDQLNERVKEAIEACLEDGLEDGILSTIPDTERNGHATQRLANITFHGVESEALLLLLDQAGICASSGSACLADSPDPSHVVAAMKPGDAARQCVRFSLGEVFGDSHIETILDRLKLLIPSLRGLS